MYQCHGVWGHFDAIAAGLNEGPYGLVPRWYSRQLEHIAQGNPTLEIQRLFAPHC